MSIENNRLLFLACAGLVASGSDGHDHADAEVCSIVEMIRAAGLPCHIAAWFARARTGQVAVNPYWPRGSCLAAACFFVDNQYRFDGDGYFAFLESTGAIDDPIGAADFRAWIAETAAHLRLVAEHPAIPSIWAEYGRAVERRAAGWVDMIARANDAARDFFGEDAPEMVFSPNLFTPYSADFVTIGRRIITIASAPDPETMLHETLHPAVTKHRPAILAFAQSHGLGGLADGAMMRQFGYMQHDSPTSAAHVIEECFVRALAAALSGGDGQRHGQYGWDGVPLIAARIRALAPSHEGLGSFVADILKSL